MSEQTYLKTKRETACGSLCRRPDDWAVSQRMACIVAQIQRGAVTPFEAAQNKEEGEQCIQTPRRHNHFKS